MRRNRNVKILATLGPASSTREQIEALFRAGADVFRINMSHTKHDLLRELVGHVRAIEADLERPIGILADLQGPKLRIGSFAGGPVMLEPGKRFTLELEAVPGGAERVQLPHKEILQALVPGARLMLDDGKLVLRVEEASPTRAVTVVEIGGRLSDRKGVNVPDVHLAIPALTEKDRADLSAAVDAGVDWIALSFVQTAADVAEAKKMVMGRAGVMAKIEKPQALERLNDILDMADGIMIARGDLGVELPLEDVPGKQKLINRAARKAGKPVVVATQMLESMIEKPAPTRAEVSDVATAVFEGADAIMLSAESAAGAWPVAAVATMNRVAERVEGEPFFRSIVEAQRAEPEATAADAITAAAHQIAENLKVAAIVTYTASGATALRASRERPNVPVLALSPVLKTARRLAIAWGLHCVVVEEPKDLDGMVDQACKLAWREGYAKIGQRVIVICGVPLGTPGATNMLRVAIVGRSVEAMQGGS
ncbi:MAG: pyruvate kinase [Alphaproteobacteria bacterium]|nr:pyruvate kinase [Alphaproteobacteria bacterium]